MGTERGTRCPIPLAEGDERGDAGREDDEDQPYHHLIGGFGIIFTPISENRPA